MSLQDQITEVKIQLEREKFVQVNTPIDSMFSHWNQYKDNRVCRMLHYLDCICGLRAAENCTFSGIGELDLDGKYFATVDSSRGYPYFTLLS